eukprot:7238837-Prymnesium_polylepis.1
MGRVELVVPCWSCGGERAGPEKASGYRKKSVLLLAYWMRVNLCQSWRNPLRTLRDPQDQLPAFARCAALRRQLERQAEDL